MQVTKSDDMQKITTIKECRAVVTALHRQGLTVGFVPTMGALHDGHMALAQHSLRDGHKTIVSIFVNPKQFGVGEDFSRYPRVEDTDAALLEKTGVDFLYVPAVTQMYPDGFATQVRVQGITDYLCGQTRPGHFEGVATVVTKLLNQLQADVAYFGEKDWQQLQVIKRLALDLDSATRIVGVPIVREEDGLALSSRNRYLNAHDRAKAPLLYITLCHLADEIMGGADTAALLKTAAHGLSENGFVVDYLELADAATLVPVHNVQKPARLFVAAKLSNTRLIDNVGVSSMGE
jgi:pantoate--beta-alanine ligase